MKKITREFAGATLTIDLTSTEIKEIVNDMLSAYAAQTKKAEPKVSFKEHKAEAMRMLEQGASRYKIAKAFGTSYQTASKWISRWELKGKKKFKATRGGRKGLTLKDGFDMLMKSKEGMTRNQIGAVYGVQPSTVTFWTKRAKSVLKGAA